MIKYSGGCPDGRSEIVGMIAKPVSAGVSWKANVGTQFVGNIILECRVEADNSNLKQRWSTLGGLEVARVEWNGSYATCFINGVFVSAVPVRPGSLMGLGRMGNRIYLTAGGLDSFYMGEITTEDVFIELETATDFRDIKTGFTTEEDFSLLQQTLGITGKLYPEEAWDITYLLDCSTYHPSLPRKCPVNICNEVGSCLQYRIIEKPISISTLKCDVDITLCRYTLSLVTDDIFTNKHLILVDGSRGYITDPIPDDKMESMFSEYLENYGLVFKEVSSADGLTDLIGSLAAGTYPDMAIIDHTDPEAPVLRIYRSISGALSNIATMSLDRPAALGSSNVINCKLAITDTYKDRDTIDNCSSIVINSCTAGCLGWINHPLALENNWSFSYRVQGDMLIDFKDGNTVWMRLKMDGAARRLSVSLAGNITFLTLEVFVGMLVKVCIVNDILSVYVEGEPYYRVFPENIPATLYVHANPGNDVGSSLIDARVNGVLLQGWEGDSVFEEVSNCGETDERTEDVVVTDLTPSCQSGKLYFREITSTLQRNTITKIFSLDNDVYRAFVDIYIENRGGDVISVDISLCTTSAPYAKDLIAPAVRINPGDTYERRSQPMSIGEGLHIRSSQDAFVLIQTIEEVYSS